MIDADRLLACFGKQLEVDLGTGVELFLEE